MKNLPSSPFAVAALTCVVTLAGVGGLAACGGGGTQERLDTLRAEHVEIIDDKGVVKMDVEKQVHALEDRIKALEAALERRAQAESAPVAPVAVEGSDAAAAPDASTADAAPFPRRIRRLGPQAPGRPMTETF